MNPYDFDDNWYYSVIFLMYLNPQNGSGDYQKAEDAKSISEVNNGVEEEGSS